MSDVVVKVENLSKQYRLGEVGTGTLSHDLNRWWHRIRGKEDPYLQLGEVNDRAVKGSSKYVWALKEINFEVKQGEVLGIIGKNGAGKSTLLKLLSRVTSPTTGEIKAKGRIASLLEVGTGFHPELTGRENIFLNGAILGMTKPEIKSKLDEIVEFSGTARYIETPVKRYSSGMRVRLAFAVAAHLEPEILIVDEVLAVGDAEFQKKALGKMQDVSQGGGRTVLFVSHNLDAIKTVCTSGILIENGKLTFSGKTNEVINKYLQNKPKINDDGLGIFNLLQHSDKKGKTGIIKAETFCNGIRNNEVEVGSLFEVIVTIRKDSLFINPEFGIVIKNQENMPLIGLNNKHLGKTFGGIDKEEIKVSFKIPKFKIYSNGELTVNLYYGDLDTSYECMYDAFTFLVKENDVYKSGKLLDVNWNVMYDPEFEIQLI